jgi:uncharacterized protein YndB with AHSA1/START domain
MPHPFTAHATVTIAAPTAKVWEALTKPELIRQYLFGTEAVSDWKVGSPLLFKGTWEGKEYLDKGVIRKVKPERFLEYTYLSSFSGLNDVPENYNVVTFELEPKGAGTTLKLRQSNIPTEQSRKHSEENWNGVLQTLKGLLEKIEQ